MLAKRGACTIEGEPQVGFSQGVQARSLDREQFG